jgi:hypothetical protein
MLKSVHKLRSPDPYFGGEVGAIGSTLEQLHEDMRRLELPGTCRKAFGDAMMQSGTRISILTFRMTC